MIAKWLKRLFRGGALEGGMDEEMRFHIEMEERELRAAGHSAAEARRLARVRFGGVDRYKEEARAVRGGWGEDAARDAAYAVRALRRRPGFAAAVVATLAVGIGATTAVWSVVDAVLLRPLPYPAPERLVRIHTSWAGEPDGAVSPAEYLDYRAAVGPVFSALGAYARGGATVGPAGEGAGAERVDIAFVSADLFSALATPPLVGRAFTAGEDLSRERVAVLSEGLWRTRYGGSPAAVGETLALNGTPYTVVGVMPSSFRLPENMVEGTRPALFVPLGIDPDTTYARGSHFLQTAGRLADGVTTERAAAAIEGIVARFSQAFPDDYEPENEFRATAVPLRDAVSGDARPALLVALAAVVLVLLVGAANVAALLLARGEARRGEIALRATLGARRPRLIRQLLVESVLLGLLGGALGAALAWAGVEAFVAMSPTGVPRLEEVAVDGRVLGFAALLSIACGLLFGLVPALRSTPDGAAAALREAGTRTTGRGGRRLRGVLVIGEIAFALTLLAGAGLLGRSLAALMAVDTGVAVGDVLTTGLGVPASRYPGDEDVRDFIAAANDRLSALPEVEAVGLVTNLPLADGIGDLGVEIPGKDLPGDGNLNVDWQVVTPGYDRAIGLRLLAGRWIEPGDRADAMGAVVINRTFAETWWPDGDALEGTLRLLGRAAPEEARIVGIVEDVRHEGPATPAGLQMYLPHRQFRFWHGGGAARSMTVVARVRPGAATAASSIRGALAELDPNVGLASFLTLEDAYRDVLSPPRLMAALLGGFAAIALLLSAIGVYGVTAYAVGQRRREFGIRVALGAGRGSILRDVLADGLRLAAVGIVLGTAGALLLSGSLRSLLFGVSPADPAVLAAGAAVLLAAALLASWIPARRAVRVHPAEALRQE